MASEHLYLAAAKVVVLLLGMAIAALAFLAHRRSGDRLMLGISVGFALAAFGSFIEGFLFELLSWDLVAVHLIESVFVLAGLGTIAFLLRPRMGRP